MPLVLISAFLAPIASLFLVYTFLYLPSREAVKSNRARQSLCDNRLEQIALALRQYYQTHGEFPPPFLRGADGKAAHSWRTMILPFTDFGSESYMYNYKEPWNSPKNLKYVSRTDPFGPANFYICPNTGDPRRSTATSYVMLVGSKAAGSLGKSVRRYEGRQSQFAIVAEVVNSGIHWAEPRDMDVTAMSFRINSMDGNSISSADIDGPAVILTNGSIRRVLGLTESEVKSLVIVNKRDPGDADSDAAAKADQGEPRVADGPLK